jgi:hypothetical protein
MQNAATAVSALVSPTPQWNIPTSGIVTGSNGSTTSIPARVEPIAMGGIKGKGLWLQSGNYVNYQIVTQPQTVSAVPWFISLFMDIRTTNGGDDGIERRILTFPDGTEVDIKGTSILELYYAQAGTQTLLASKPLPTGLTMPTPGWWHLAFQVAPGGKSIGIFVNGYLLWTYTSTQALFQLTPGNLAVGGDPSSTTQGFNGWIDEFKVIAQNVDYETVCNHAHGTLVGLTKGVSDPFWWTVSGYYQSTTEQTFINGVLGAKSYPGYACYHDYSFDMNAAYIGSPEMTSGNLSSIRAALHFPEGPLVYNQFRPISTANSFCMSCHTDSGGQFSGTLHNSVVVPPSTYAPLVGGNQNTGFMDVDPRRQPMHNQRVIFGNIPLDFINHQYPSPAQVAPRTGTGLDQWTFQ